MKSASQHDFPKSIRLRRSEDFRAAQRRGRRVRTKHLVVCVYDSGQPGPRFGLAVSRKVGNAVVRNRVKRWLREAIRLERAGAPGGHERAGTAAVDLVFIARSSAADAGLAALRREVSDVLSRVRGEAR